MANQGNPFQRATKAQSKLRLAITGPAGSGKTFTALEIAQAFGKTAVIDTERGSAAKYAGQFEFDVLELEQHDPEQYIGAIRAAVAYGYEALIIDSLSHAWAAVLERVDAIAKKSQSQNTFMAWRDVTPVQNRFIDAILSAPLHVIATMRIKTEYVMEQVESKGRMVTVPRKVGLAPIQRDQVDYEFDVVLTMDVEQNAFVTKTRCPDLTGVVIQHPSADDLGAVLKAWLSDGDVVLPTSDKWKRIASNADPSQAQTFTSADGWKTWNVAMKQKYPRYAIEAKFEDVFGVKQVSQITGTLTDAEGKIKAWLAELAAQDGHPEEAEAILNDVQGDKQPPPFTPDKPAEEDDPLARFDKKPVDQPPGDKYHVEYVQVQKAKGPNNFSYVMKTTEGSVIHIYEGDAFRLAGLKPDEWKKNGHVERFDPHIEVWADFENNKWIVYQIDVPEVQF